MNSRQEEEQAIQSALKSLTDRQVSAVLTFATTLTGKIAVTFVKGGLLSNEATVAFGDKLLVHHIVSQEPLSKDRFEHALREVLIDTDSNVELAPRGNPGHDMTIEGERFSLKTQANRAMRPDVIWISKWMELGKGLWTDQPRQLEGLRKAYLDRLKTYDRILVLRAMRIGLGWRYELLEIPKRLMKSASRGELEMMLNSKQSPKPGYCRVYGTKSGDGLLYSLYFDGGTERKLQVKDLKTSLCKLQGRWVIADESSH